MKSHLYHVKIFIALVGGFILSYMSLVVFFPSKTPILRPDLSSYLTNGTRTLLTNAQRLIPKFNPIVYVSPVPPQSSSSSNQSSDMTVVALSNIAAGVRTELASQKSYNSSPGVYISNNAQSYLTVLKQKEAKWMLQSYNINGRIVQIRIPAGQTGPPSEIIEAALR